MAKNFEYTITTEYNNVQTFHKGKYKRLQEAYDAVKELPIRADKAIIWEWDKYQYNTRCYVTYNWDGAWTKPEIL